MLLRFITITLCSSGLCLFMTHHYSCLENPMDGGAWKATVHGVTEGWTPLSDFTFTFHFHALEKEIATYFRVLAWRIPGTRESGGLPSMGLHRVGHDWSDLAAVAAVTPHPCSLMNSFQLTVSNCCVSAPWTAHSGGILGDQVVQNIHGLQNLHPTRREMVRRYTVAQLPEHAADLTTPGILSSRWMVILLCRVD